MGEIIISNGADRALVLNVEMKETADNYTCRLELIDDEKIDTDKVVRVEIKEDTLEEGTDEEQE